MPMHAIRSRGTGLYDNLQRYNLPNPEAVFTLDYFKVRASSCFHDPPPFFARYKLRV